MGAVFSEEEDKDTINISPSRPPCLCYCSYKCGPREAKPHDIPFFDQKYGVCFCAVRDRIAYLKNNCPLKDPTGPQKTTCCKI